MKSSICLAGTTIGRRVVRSQMNRVIEYSPFRQDVFIQGLLVGEGEQQVIDGRNPAADDLPAPFFPEQAHRHERAESPVLKNLLHFEFPAIGHPERVSLLLCRRFVHRFPYMSS